jgi:hypothetical protein
MSDEEAAEAAKPDAPVKTLDHQPAGEVKSKVGSTLS